jgi:hypothetical protein
VRVEVRDLLVGETVRTQRMADLPVGETVRTQRMAQTVGTLEEDQRGTAPRPLGGMLEPILQLLPRGDAHRHRASDQLADRPPIKDRVVHRATSRRNRRQPIRIQPAHHFAKQNSARSHAVGVIPRLNTIGPHDRIDHAFQLFSGLHPESQLTI